MSGTESKLVVVEAVNQFRIVVQQLMALHLKRQRDHIVRLRQQFLTKLSRRVRQNFLVYRRKRQQLEEDVVAMTPKRSARLLRQTYDRTFLSSFSSPIRSPFDDERMDMLRMDAETFRFLCDVLRKELLPGKAPIMVGAALTIEMKIAIALYVLGTGADYRRTGRKFDVHFTTVRKCVHTFCQAVVKTCRANEIQMATNVDQLDGVIKDFEDFVGIPQVMGIIGCLHIAITLPADEPTQYINSSGWSSIVLQAVVDRHGRFMDISCKQPGRANDETVLLESSLYQSMEEQEHPLDRAKTVDGKEVHPFLLGDRGYPLLPWLITQYHLPSDPASGDHMFNVYIAKARNVIATAFERLAGRWKVLNRCLHMDIALVPDIIATCCILHNIAERRGTPFRKSWSAEGGVDGATPSQPQWTCGIVTAEGEELRNHLAKYMVNNFPFIADDDD